MRVSVTGFGLSANIGYKKKKLTDIRFQFGFPGSWKFFQGFGFRLMFLEHQPTSGSKIEGTWSESNSTIADFSSLKIYGVIP